MGRFLAETSRRREATLPRRFLAAAARAGVLRRARLPRLAHILECAWLRYLELASGKRTRSVAMVRGPITQDVLRNVALWQHGILQGGAIPSDGRIHGTLCVAGDAETVQLDRLFSVVCLSDVFDNFDICWEENAVLGTTAPAFTGAAHPGGAAEDIRYDLSAPARAGLGALSVPPLRRALAVSFDSGRTSTGYLKVAHPRMFVVALSLPEDADGMADAALAEWLPHLRRFRQESPRVAFCLLNRTRLGQEDTDLPQADVAPVRSFGLCQRDAVALAQEANAFLGCSDIFGLAALAARRPGVYFGMAGEGTPWLGPGLREETDRSPEHCLEALRHIIRESRSGTGRAEAYSGRAGGDGEGSG